MKTMKHFNHLLPRLLWITCLSVSLGKQVSAQKQDTILINPKTIQVSSLKPGTVKYLVYIKNSPEGPATEMQLWNITTSDTEFNGQKALIVQQSWDYKDTVVHTAKSICSKTDFLPLYHESWWKQRGKQVYDPLKQQLTVNDLVIDSANSSARNKTLYKSFRSSLNTYYLNWHLDMEVLRMLPYKKNTTFLIPFYEFGYDTPKKIPYTVSGEAKLEYNNKSESCWLLKHTEDGNSETFWISKETREVLKFEQTFGKIYRYKIKLPM